jgi:IS605 OrfB family transposase
MVQRQLKLKLTKKQEATLEEWLPILTSIWNWAIRKIELDAQGGIYYYSCHDFQNLLAGASKTLSVPSHTIQGILSRAHMSWKRCYQKLANKPRLKGNRNRLNNIPFPDPINTPAGNKIKLRYLGTVRYHKQTLPHGKIKRGHIVRRASGWYLCLCIEAEPPAIPKLKAYTVGIDPGYKHLITLSTGEKVAHPNELQKNKKRLAQAQRSHNNKLVSRLHERIANQRKDRNHKLSRRLVAESQTIVFSKDNLHGLSRSGFGKSVESASHGQLRSMLSYKCRAGGREYIEVPSKGSTRVCSTCGASTGPTGRAELKVRQWTCSACGAHHDRDVNAAINTLIAGVGATPERRVAWQRLPSEISSDTQRSPQLDFRQTIPATIKLMLRQPIM